MTRTFETVYFTASKSVIKKSKPVKIEQLIELTINRKTKEFEVCQSSEEGIRFDDVTIEGAELKLEALKSAIKYVKENL